MTTRAEQILREHLPAIVEAGEDGAFLRNVLADHMEEADEKLHAEFWRLAAKMCWTPREEKREDPFPFDWFSTDGGPSPHVPEKCRVPP